MSVEFLSRKVLNNILEYEKLNYICTGYEELDNMIGGFVEGNLYVLAGRASMGLTTFALNVINEIAVKNKQPVLYFSLSESYAQLARRLIAIACYNKYSDIEKVSSQYSISPKKAMDGIVEQISNSKVCIIDGFSRSIDTFEEMLRENNDVWRVKFVIVDSLELMKEYDLRNPEKNRTVLEKIKNIAKDLNIAILLLSHYSNRVEYRPNKRPMVSDLVGLSNIEEYVGNIWFMYRDDYYNEFSDYEGKAEIIIARSNHGTTGMAHIPFDNCAKWTNYVVGRDREVYDEQP